MANDTPPPVEPIQGIHEPMAHFIERVRQWQEALARWAAKDKPPTICGELEDMA